MGKHTSSIVSMSEVAAIQQVGAARAAGWKTDE
jgi:hypothetical protein